MTRCLSICLVISVCVFWEGFVEKGSTQEVEEWCAVVKWRTKVANFIVHVQKGLIVSVHSVALFSFLACTQKFKETKIFLHVRLL